MTTDSEAVAAGNATVALPETGRELGLGVEEDELVIRHNQVESTVVESRIPSPPVRTCSGRKPVTWPVPPSPATAPPGRKFIAGDPMKPATKTLRGFSYRLLGGPDLLEDAVPEHRDPVTHRHRLDLVVGDVDGRRPEPPLQLEDLRARLQTQLRVEVRERLIHQECHRLPDDGPRGSDEPQFHSCQPRALIAQWIEQRFNPKKHRLRPRREQ